MTPSNSLIDGRARARRPRAAALILATCWITAVANAAPDPGIDLPGMDRTVTPGDDFFRHANGVWLKTTEIPADRGSHGVGAIVTDLTNERTVELIQQAAAGTAAAGSAARKIGDYYASFMDLPAIEATGLRPLQPAFDRIAAIRDVRDLSRVLGGTLRADVDALNSTNFYTDNLFGLWVAQDFNEPKRYVPFLLQGGLDMPDREYYVDPSPRMAEIRAKHQAHIAAVLKLAGLADADARAARIFDLERRIAEAHWKREDSEDVRKANNPWTRKTFDTAAPGLDWTAFFAEAGLAGQDDFIVWQPSAVTGIAALVASQPLESWKDYLTFHAIEHSASILPDAFGDRELQLPRHGARRHPAAPRPLEEGGVGRRTSRSERRSARLYVERHFPPAAKARAEEMVTNIQAAFARRIDSLDWMTAATKAQAKAKLAVLKVGVGYPDRWLDYSDLEVVRGDAFGNLQRAEMFEYRRNLREARPSRRPRRVGDDAADRQRRQPARDERDELPGRHPAAAVLRPRAAGGHGLRRHRRHHRPRDQPQLRRPGRAVRRPGTPEELVDRRGPRALPRPPPQSSSSSTTRTARCPTSP